MGKRKRQSIHEDVTTSTAAAATVKNSRYEAEADLSDNDDSMELEDLTTIESEEDGPDVATLTNNTSALALFPDWLRPALAVQ